MKPDEKGKSLKSLAFLSRQLRFDFIANFLNARAPRERLFLVGFAAVLAILLDYMLWFAPVTRTLTRTVSTLSLLQTQLDELEHDKKNEAAIRQKWESIQQELLDMEGRVGASGQIAPMLEDLSKLASESGVRIVSLTPSENAGPAVSKLYLVVPIQISAMAGTHQVGAFLMRLETGSTFYKVLDLRIAANPADERKHLIEMKVETYRRA